MAIATRTAEELAAAALSACYAVVARSPGCSPEQRSPSKPRWSLVLRGSPLQHPGNAQMASQP